MRYIRFSFNMLYLIYFISLFLNFISMCIVELKYKYLFGLF